MDNNGQITSFGTSDDKSSMTPVDPQQGGAQTANISSVSEGSVPTTDMTRVLPRQVSTGVGRGVQSQGANNFQMNPGMAQQVINDNTTNRVLIGNIGNDWGMKVSKPGFDVTTASNNDLIFNSSQNVFKIVGTYTSTFPIVQANVLGGVGFDWQFESINLEHNLGYTPVFIAYQGDDMNGYLPVEVVNLFGGSDYIGSESLQIFVDSVNFQITTTVNIYANAGAGRSISGGGKSVKIYALQETAN